MLDIAFYLIGEAASNPLVMFCFCNLIIVMILTGSSKSGSMESQDSTFATSMSFNVCNISSYEHYSCYDDDEEKVVSVVSSSQDESLVDNSSLSNEDEDREGIHCCDYDDDEVEDDYDDEEEKDENEEIEEAEIEEEEEEGEDDLRTRVEEFIAKINNEWRHERLKAFSLVY